jgi:hypothetical protein
MNTQQEIIYGVRLASQSQPTPSADNANKTPAMELVAADLKTGQVISVTPLPERSVDNPQDQTPSTTQAFSILSDRITGFTAQLDENGGFVIATVISTERGNFSRLLFADRRAARSKKVTGFQQSQETVESLVALPNSDRPKTYRLLSILSLNGGIPPFDLGAIDPRSGKVSFGAKLAMPELAFTSRFSNLARSPNGTIYATTLGSEGVAMRARGSASLVQIDLTNKSPITGRGKITPLVQLRFNDQPLEMDLQSLAVSPSGQLFALADPEYTGRSSLCAVNPTTGQMQLLRPFAVDKITFARS